MPIDPLIARGGVPFEVDNTLARIGALKQRDQMLAQDAQANALMQQRFSANQAQAVTEQQMVEKWADIEQYAEAPPEVKAAYVAREAERNPGFAQTPLAQMAPEQAFDAMRRGLAAKLGKTVEQPQAPLQQPTLAQQGGYSYLFDPTKGVIPGSVQAPQRAPLGGSGGQSEQRPPSGYQWKADGTLEPIPGGPATGKPTQVDQASANPLPTGALRIVDEASQALAATSESDAIVTKAIETLEKGNVQLGAIRNAESRSRNFAGASDDNSRAYADIRQTLEKLRNNYLLLAKGVQTEGDAQRAWNSEIGESALNDNELALQQLKKAQAMTKRAQAAQTNRINTVRANYGNQPTRPGQGDTDPLAAHAGKVIKQGEKRYQVIQGRDGKYMAVELR